MILKPEYNNESIFLSYFTVRRKYKKNKRTIVEDMKLNESFVHKGIDPNVIIRRRGMLARLRKKTSWAKGTIEIIDIEFLAYTGEGVKEELIDISLQNV